MPLCPSKREAGSAGPRHGRQAGRSKGENNAKTFTAPRRRCPCPCFPPPCWPAGQASAQNRQFSFAYDQPHTTAYGFAADIFAAKLKELSERQR